MATPKRKAQRIKLARAQLARCVRSGNRDMIEKYSLRLERLQWESKIRSEYKHI